MRWAEAVAVERIHGDRAPLWIAERLGVLAADRDGAGVKRLLEVARRLDALMRGRASRDG